MAPNIEIRKPKLLLVEGRHDEEFFTAWLSFLKITDTQVLVYEGMTKLRNYLGLLVKRPEFLDGKITSLVIVRDADDNPRGGFQSVSDTLKACHLPVPSKPWAIASNTNPQVGIVILPGPDRSGALEELLLDAADQDIVYPMALDLIDRSVAALSVPGAPRNPPPVHRRGKARIHAFLSTFEEPDRDPGKAVLAGIWNFEHPALQPLGKLLLQM
jgi:hypothetical protein